MTDSIGKKLVEHAREILSGILDLNELDSITKEDFSRLQVIIDDIAVSTKSITPDVDVQNANGIIYCLKALRLCNEEMTRALFSHDEMSETASAFSNNIKSLIANIEHNSSGIIKKEGDDWEPLEKANVNNVTGPLNSAQEACGYANQHLAQKQIFSSGFGERLSSLGDRLFNGNSIKDVNWGDFKTKPPVSQNKKNKVELLAIPTLSFKEFEESTKQNKALVLMTEAISQVRIALYSLGNDFTADDLTKASKNISKKMPTAKNLDVEFNNNESDKETFNIHKYISKCFDEAKENLINAKPSLSDNIKAFFASVKAMFSKIIPVKSNPSLEITGNQT